MHGVTQGGSCIAPRRGFFRRLGGAVQVARCCRNGVAAIKSPAAGEPAVPAVWSAGLRLHACSCSRNSGHRVGK
jgi:hypothetical protein